MSPLSPRSSGVHVADASIRWITLSAGAPGHRKVESWGEFPLEQGIVERGIVCDTQRLSHALAMVRPHVRKSAVINTALPREAAHVFSFRIPQGMPRDQIPALIQFEWMDRVPLRPSEAVYSYDSLGEEPEGEGIAVTAYPKEVSERHLSAFADARIRLVSAEIATRSAARAVSSATQGDLVEVLLEISEQPSIAFVKRGIPVFVAHIGDIPREAIPEEVARYVDHWRARRTSGRGPSSSLGGILLVGEGAQLSELAARVAERARAPAVLGNVWRHIANFSDYIPPIDRDASLRFAVAAGLALRES